jgi:hypothetical protein
LWIRDTILVKSRQQLLDITGKKWNHLDPGVIQPVDQMLGDGSAQQDLRMASLQPFHAVREGPISQFQPQARGFPAAVEIDQQKLRGRIENG